MIINIGSTFPLAPLNPATLPRPAPSGLASKGMDRDTVEVSGRATALAYAVEKSSLRLARTRAVRAEIMAGTYETQERIDGTVERILDVIA